MERLADPTILETLTLGEKLFESLKVMLLGAGIVFLVLIVLWMCINLIGRALRKK